MRQPTPLVGICPDAIFGNIESDHCENLNSNTRKGNSPVIENFLIQLPEDRSYIDRNVESEAIPKEEFHFSTKWFCSLRSIIYKHLICYGTSHHMKALEFRIN